MTDLLYLRDASLDQSDAHLELLMHLGPHRLAPCRHRYPMPWPGAAAVRTCVAANRASAPAVNDAVRVPPRALRRRRSALRGQPQQRPSGDDDSWN